MMMMTIYGDKMATKNELSDAEKFIISQALTEFDGSNAEEVLSKVGSTVVGINKKSMETFVDLMKMKSEKLLKIKWKPLKNPIEDYMCAF